MIYRSRDSKAVSAWIRDCRGAYTHGGETVCAGFFLYRGFVGCPAWAAGKPCSYCYLKTTFRTDPELRKGVAWVDQHPFRSVYDSVDNARAAVENWLQRGRSCAICSVWPCQGHSHLLREAVVCEKYRPMLLDAGELADSLGLSPDENPHIAMLLDLFSSPETNPHGHKLLLVTKAGLEATQAHLEPHAPSRNVILSWSVGDGGDMEPYWPYVSERGGRLDAAGWAQQQGWRVRLRIDPITTNDDLSLHRHVREILGAPPCVFRLDKLDCLTLGALRHRGGRQKETAEYRAAVYGEVVHTARYSGYEGPIGLCKETPEMIRDVLEIKPGEMRCNCLP